jgi:hypothetical protein
MLIIQAKHSRSLAGKWRIANLSQWTGMVSFLFSFLFLAGDLASAMFYSWLRRTPFPALTFIASSPQYKWCVFYYNLPWRGRFCLTFASSRHGPRPSFSKNKFFILTINLTAKPISDPRNLLKSALRVFLKSARWLCLKYALQLQARTAGSHLLGFVAILAPSLFLQLIVLILPCSH